MSARSHLFAHMRANRAKRNEALERLAQADHEACAINSLAVSHGMRPPHTEASNYQECLKRLETPVVWRDRFVPDWKKA